MLNDSLTGEVSLGEPNFEPKQPSQPSNTTHRHSAAPYPPKQPLKVASQLRGEKIRLVEKHRQTHDAGNFRAILSNIIEALHVDSTGTLTESLQRDGRIATSNERD